MSDPFDLRRFEQAQGPVFTRVLDELRSGQKASHWMWFVFPQIAGLGASAMSQRYAIGSLDEATAYLDHPVLGSRLRTCVDILLSLQGLSAHAVFGSPDDRKLHSSLTLFAEAAGDPGPFHEALAKYFDGEPDAATSERLQTRHASKSVGSRF